MKFAPLLLVVAAAAGAAGTARAEPLSIDDALRAAQPASESIEAAQADVDRASAQVDAAESGWYPQVNGSSQYQRQIRSEFEGLMFGEPGMEVTLPFGQRNTWRVGLTLTQPLFDGFRTARAVDQAKAGVRLSKLTVNETRTQVVLQVAQAYYDAAFAQRSVEIAEETLKQAESTLADTKLGYEQGASPEFDLVRAEVARDNQSNTVIQFTAQRDLAFVALRRLVGVPVDAPLELSSSLDADDVDAVVASARTAAGLPESGTRTAIAAAKEVVTARAAAVGVAKADRWPQLAVGSELGLVDYTDQPFNTDWRTNWTVAISLSIPLFDGFRRRASIRAAAADLKAARARLTEATEQSDIEAAQSQAAVAAAAATLETSTRTVGQAKRAYDIAELRFQQGASNHLELVDARVQLEQSLLNQARAARDLRVSRLRQELLPGLPIGAQ